MEISAKDKIRIACSIVGAWHVFDIFEKFMTSRNREDWDAFLFEEDGSIYHEETGRYLSDVELEEFVEYSEKLNKD